ncbi:immunoglobulin-binding protein 1 [Lampris incognitus]|uniref:immunoglobulin-binding protein 1 n=1 Tax=Lampris incognitus TaxID=2546036 RepID=UPI0024B4BA1C|nr:immunoglobulin-binding protein 1 [Lampris incognitus]
MAASERRENAQQLAGVHAEPRRLCDLLDCGWKLFEEVDTTNESTGSNHIQVKVKRGITALEEASRMAAQLDLFSRNELLEEIATTDLKYLLLPVLLGALTMKQTNRATRLQSVQMARVYFYDFLRRCKDYNVSNFELPFSATENSTCGEELENGADKNKPTASATQPNLVAMATQRQAKIERYRQRKETEAKLSEIRRVVESGQADDEAVRGFYLLNLKKWVMTSLEEIESIDQEVAILKRTTVPNSTESSSEHKHPSRPPVKPFILTKDAVQAKVFGAGYPSLATMTVDDWYEQRQKCGFLPDQGVPRTAAVIQDYDTEELAEEEKEKRVEMDDEEALQKARDWDDWKDTHRRGYGNRKNMG